MAKNIMLIVSLVFLFAHPASAHEGPPYPLLVDWKLGDGKATLWVDPDVGIGSFIFVAEGALLAVPDLKFVLKAQPADGTSPAQTAVSRPDPTRAGQFLAEIPFASRGVWQLTIEAQFAGQSETKQTEVEVTPPGLGAVDLIWYALPFVAIGGLWIAAALRGRRRRV